MSYNNSFHPAAEKEYIEAYQWYEEHLEGLGNRLVGQLKDRLNSFPKTHSTIKLKSVTVGEVK
ncbi:hypothetical protein [Pedobacter sp. V48]|uniref:hypothetical protein n=1 Tax=Pedobacter sp. V48 TaxID=509635 RepID=UPI0003E53F88|nr:hypothetical protein [Pedobacter sp. V48]ETZ21160.1 hypothetical protein N824_03300 [Pedobacter sp. V48]